LSDIFLALACDIHSLLIPIGFLLVVAASVIYAGGQIGSAEMRGKSQGWATWALVGAIISFVIAERGFLFEFLKTWERVLFFLTSLLLIIPGNISSSIGLFLFIIVFYVHKKGIKIMR